MAKVKTTMQKAQAAQTPFEGRKYVYAKGRRKTAVASVRLFEKGKNFIEINGKPLNEYYTNASLQGLVKEALVRTSTEGQFDISIKVHGGGQHSQAESIRHAISKALVTLDKERRTPLKKLGFLTRDPRQKERKKPGLKRARRAPQWSKR